MTSTYPSQAAISTISNAFPGLDLDERLAAVRRKILGKLVFTTSFGIEDQAIADAIFTQHLEIEVVTLDTGRLFPETYELWATTEHRYGLPVRALYPDHKGLEPLVARQGINGFRTSVEARRACCAVRKVEPLWRALADAAGGLPGCVQTTPPIGRVLAPPRLSPVINSSK